MFACLHHEGQGSAIYSKFAQLERIKFRPSPFLSRPNQLSEGSKEIYSNLVKRHYGVHNTSTLPDCYLYITENRSGEYWIIPIDGDTLLDLERLIDGWVLAEYGGELERDGDLGPSGLCDYDARINIKANPDSAVCWESAGFYLSYPSTRSEEWC